jgi:glycosyltransferase involved in cell wall biosynthesis
MLPNYIKGFDVCIIPFQSNKVTRDSFPLKFFEYLAAGKPVVATEIPSLQEFVHLFTVAKDADHFSVAIQNALDRDNQTQSLAIQNSISKYSWNHRIEDLSKLVSQAIQTSEQVSQ